MKFGMLVNTQDPPDGNNIPRLYEEVLQEAERAAGVAWSHCGADQAITTRHLDFATAGMAPHQHRRGVVGTRQHI